MAEQEIKTATLSPTASVLSLKGETKEKAYVVLPLERRKGSLLVPLGEKTDGWQDAAAYARSNKIFFDYGQDLMSAENLLLAVLSEQMSTL